MKELLLVMWALHMSQAIGQMLFPLVYGSEAMLPTEVEQKSPHVQQYSEEQCNNSRVDDLTKLEELHEAAVIQSAKHLQAMRCYHAHNISSRRLK
jgi:hypothetical protein